MGSMAETEERVIELVLGVCPEPGAPMPMLAQGSFELVLVFRAVTEPDGEPKTGVVEASMCTVSQFGYPNDEALSIDIWQSVCGPASRERLTVPPQNGCRQRVLGSESS